MLICMNPILEIKKFINSSKRVMRVATKPTKEQYIRTLKITSAGVGLLGVIAFVVYVTFELVRRVVLRI